MFRAIADWRKTKKLHAMLSDPRATRGFRSTVQLEKGIGADRATTERLLAAMGAHKSDSADEWSLGSH